MKYIIIAGTAVLASRNAESVPIASGLSVEVEGAPDGASLSVYSEQTSASCGIKDGTALLRVSELPAGIYHTVITWSTENGGESIACEAVGNPFKLTFEGDNAVTVPAPLSGMTELEALWTAIADIVGVLLPFMDDVKNGSSVI